jgi:hypothetical protein
LLDWIYMNESLVWWLLASSVITFIASLIMVPLVLTRLPQDYFISKDRSHLAWAARHPAQRITLLLLKNLFGIIFVLAGIIMLALPGQGILTILVGLVLVDFPGKYGAERWVVSQRSVLRAINWIRAKSGKPHLIVSLNKD